MGKRRKKNKKTYPRNMETVFKKPIIVAGERGLVAHIDNGCVTLCDRFGVPYPQSDFDMVKTYTGMSKTRVITKVLGLATGGNTVGEWVKNFDVVYAADTNTRKIVNGKYNFSIGCVFKGIINQTHENGGNISCERYATYAWIWSGEYKIEQETWVRAIQKIQTEESAERRIGFVVDSDLGNLEAYSDRSQALLNDFFLPENFTLIYASADYSDEWTNQMIKNCDKVAGLDIEKNLPIIEGLDEKKLPVGTLIDLGIQVP